MMSETQKAIDQAADSTLDQFETLAAKAKDRVPWQWSIQAYESHLRLCRTQILITLRAKLESDLGNREAKAQHHALIKTGAHLLGRIREWVKRARDTRRELAIDYKNVSQDLRDHRRVRQSQSDAGRRRADANADRDAQIQSQAKKMTIHGVSPREIRRMLAERNGLTPTRISQILRTPIKNKK